MEDNSVATLLAEAAQGDDRAWQELVDRFNGLLWSIARAHRLSTADAADVVQTAWLRLVENLDRIHDPAHLGAWLATTTRRECLRVLRASGRLQLVDDAADLRVEESVEASPEAMALTRERDALLLEALDEVPERCQRLLRVLMTSPAPSYTDVSAALAMPVGSIGPTRARCLACLRRRVERRELVAVGAA